MSEKEHAPRIDIARSTLLCIEKGDAVVGMCPVFQEATLIGVDLFVPESAKLVDARLDSNREALCRR